MYRHKFYTLPSHSKGCRCDGCQLYNQYLQGISESAASGGSFATAAYKYLVNKYRRSFCKKRDSNGNLIPVRDLETGELHPLCANWMGPGTNIDKAAKYPSWNAADDCARVHDYQYRDAMNATTDEERQRLIRKADQDIIECLKKTDSSNEPYKTLGSLGIESKVRAEDLIPNLIRLVAPKEYIGASGVMYI